MNLLKDLWIEEDAVGVVEIILILVVLIGLVIIFKGTAYQSGGKYPIKDHQSEQQHLIFSTLGCRRSNTMKIKGSMTCTMCLLLLVLLSLLGACIRSSRVSAGRVQAVNAMDTAMYSLFAQYDRDLLKDYHLFFLDGGYGENSLTFPSFLHRRKHLPSRSCPPGSPPVHLEACGIKGFRLASDNNGAAVQTQIIRYMKDNLGSKGIELIKKRLAQNKAVMEEQEKDPGRWIKGSSY